MREKRTGRRWSLAPAGVDSGAAAVDPAGREVAGAVPDEAVEDMETGEAAALREAVGVDLAIDDHVRPEGTRMRNISFPRRSPDGHNQTRGIRG